MEVEIDEPLDYYDEIVIALEARLVAIGSAIVRRHNDDHSGLIGSCTDPICDEWTRTLPAPGSVI